MLRKPYEQIIQRRSSTLGFETPKINHYEFRFSSRAYLSGLWKRTPELIYAKTNILYTASAIQYVIETQNQYN